MVGMEAYGGGVRERERERKRRRVGKDNSFCSAGERLKGGKKKKKRRRRRRTSQLTYANRMQVFFFLECLIYFRGVGLVGWLVRKGRGEKKRDQIEREMSSYV